MKVIAYDPYLTEQRALALGVEKVELADLLARADIITLHTPLTDSDPQHPLARGDRRRPGRACASSTARAAG